jgi:phosphoribosylformimino-5-aminoimidazole carboxamide ribonucleotide (ProFAR) isomerase
MKIYGRVNILDGTAVRLPKGDLTEVIPLDADPIDRAQGWVAKGCDRVLVVDLDAAIRGEGRNFELLTELVGAVDARVTVTGGVRSQSHVGQLLDAGAWRVGIGTQALLDQTFTYDICRRHPGRIVVTFDVDADERIWTRGRTIMSDENLEEGLRLMQASGAAGYMIAEVGRDALIEPPNVAALLTALETVDVPVIAAGGVRDLDDLRTLDAVEVGGHRLDGVVVGREVTAGRFTIEEALAAVR